VFEDLAGRVAVVTGGARGLGLSMARALARHGVQVGLVDLLDDVHASAKALADDLGVESVGTTADVTSADDVAAAFARIAETLGSPALLVNAAGITVWEDSLDVTAESWRRVIDINLTGTFLCARRGLGPMRERGYGRIVTISSGAGLDGGSEECAHYAASKGGVIALTKALAKEYVRDGVLVNVVAPRAVRTPMLDGMTDGMDELVPVGRIGEPDDVAAAVAFLCSAHASYVSGEVVVLNGGWW